MIWFIDPFQIIENVISIGEVVIEIAKWLLLIWLISGGWLYAVRAVEFIIDKTLCNFIATIYKYFLEILEGTMFNEDLVNDIVMNIYIFIGVVIIFRLILVLMKYLINPDLVADAKLGTNTLIKRVLIGFVGILFIPTIFDIGMRLQAAIIKDQIIQKLIIPRAAIDAVGDHIQDGGKYMGAYVLAGFVNPSSVATQTTKSEFEVAVQKGDFSNVKVNRGGFLRDANDYEYSYIIVVSTICLLKVLSHVLTYTVDLAVRAFKMLVFQILAPIAMVEYMISGADSGVFANWKKAVIACYASIFAKVASLWFVIFVTLLMSGSLPGYTNGSLLATDDYLLRAIIIIALIGFMMDFPKLIGDVFGFDFVQQSSASGIIKDIGGVLKTAAGGALALGAGAVGGAMGAAKQGLGSLKGAAHDINAAKKLGDPSKVPTLKDALANNGMTGASAAKHLNAIRDGAFKGIAEMNPYTKAAFGAYTGAVSGQEDIDKKAEEKKKQAQRDQWAEQTAESTKRSADIDEEWFKHEKAWRRHDTGQDRDSSVDDARDNAYRDYTGITQGMEANAASAIATAMAVASASGNQNINVSDITAQITQAIQGTALAQDGADSRAAAQSAMTDIATQLRTDPANVDAITVDANGQVTDIDVGALHSAGSLTIPVGATLESTIQSEIAASAISTVYDQGYAASGYDRIISVSSDPTQAVYDTAAFQHGVNAEPLEVMQDIKVSANVTAANTSSINGTVSAMAGDVQHISSQQDVIVDTTQRMHAGQQRMEGQLSGIQGDVGSIKGDVRHISQQTDTIVDTTEQIRDGEQRIEGQVRGIRRDTRKIRDEVHNIDRNVETVVNTTNTISENVNNISTITGRAEQTINDIRRDTGKIANTNFDQNNSAWDDDGN